jgi:hypothetical protein
MLKNDSAYKIQNYPNNRINFHNAPLNLQVNYEKIIFISNNTLDFQQRIFYIRKVFDPLEQIGSIFAV